MKKAGISRRQFIKTSGQIAVGSTLTISIITSKTKAKYTRRPNVIFITADQMRAQAPGCMGNEQIKTPNIDKLAAQGILFTNAISNFPICTPARAMWLTGRYPVSTGVISNDMQLPFHEVTSAEILRANGYMTGYIGKWHLDGPDRKGFTPPGQRRQGFDYWAAANICHKYFQAFYYKDIPEKIHIDGYQPDHETNLAIQFLEKYRKEPFFLNLHWGPPHDPYIAPREYLILYDPEKIKLRENVTHCVPKNIHSAIRQQISAYYAAITNLDWNMGRLLKAIDDLGLTDNTVVIFTSDHGDMLFSLALQFKLWPYEESIRVPLIVRYPAGGSIGIRNDFFIGSVDIMPTILSLCNMNIPKNVQGIDFSKSINGEKGPDPESALIMCVQPCARYIDRAGLQAWRGLRTKRYTYVRFKHEDWCLYDNEKDPYQRRNLFAVDYNKPEVKELRNKLNSELHIRLHAIGDTFDVPAFPKVRWH
jgi:arylsulfatase A-like enzyme